MEIETKDRLNDLMHRLIEPAEAVSTEVEAASLATTGAREILYNFAFIDEDSKREVRRKLLKAVALPGHLVPFASRDLPIARGWGTGGLQVTMSLVEPCDTLKVIDQGDDDSVNAVNLRRFIEKTTGVHFTSDTTQATIVQTRHRVPEEAMRADQILVLQVPMADSLRVVEPVVERATEMHAEADYGRMWVYMYESVVRSGDVDISSQYPVMVEDRYIMDTSPIPRYDVPRLHQNETLYLFGAGREKRVYAIPPYTKVVPLQFEDYPFKTEHDPAQQCERCGSNDTFLTRVFVEPKTAGESARWMHICSDTSFRQKRVQAKAQPEETEHVAL